MAHRTPAAAPLTAPMLEQHYKEVVSFQDARAKSARLMSRGVLAGLAVSMVANVGLAWSIASMLPLTKLVPVYLLVHRDGTIDTSVALSTMPHHLDEAVTRAALWQYVELRESYSYETNQYRYDVVSAMSDAVTRTQFQQYFNAPNPQSPQNVIGRTGTVTVEPITVAMIAPEVAQIRFQRSFVAGTNAPVVTTWTATLQFEQVDTLPAKDRLTNPGGIIVTNYQAEEDTLP
jgi:type IV secretion system protein VirB8